MTAIAVLDEHTRTPDLAFQRRHPGTRRVVGALSDADIVIDDIGVRRPTLDDVFLSLTGHAAAQLADDETVAATSTKTAGRTVMTTTIALLSRVSAAGARHWPTAWIVMWRNLKRIPRIPELAIFAVIQSIMFVLLFAFVFGGAIPLPGYPGPERVPRVPDARHLRPDHLVRIRNDRHRHDRRHDQGTSSTASGRCPWHGPRC